MIVLLILINLIDKKSVKVIKFNLLNKIFIPFF